MGATLSTLLAFLAIAGQTPQQPTVKLSRPCVVEGVVLKVATGEPLKKAFVTLRKAEESDQGKSTTTGTPVVISNSGISSRGGITCAHGGTASPAQDTLASACLAHRPNGKAQESVLNEPHTDKTSHTMHRSKVTAALLDSSIKPNPVAIVACQGLSWI